MEEKDNKTKREILIDSILEKTNKYSREQLEKILDEKENQLIEFVLRQTNMKREDVTEKLNKNDFDSIKVIKEHFGIKDKKNNNVVSVNQQVYREIRGFMDKAAKQYRFSKELEKRKEEMLEFIRERENRVNENKKLLTTVEVSHEEVQEN
jgi:hypothetical protein